MKPKRKLSQRRVQTELHRIYLQRFINEIERVAMKLETIDDTDLACAVGTLQLQSAVERFREDWKDLIYEAD